MVVRVDGRAFHKFVEVHKYDKPNDDRGLKLMNKCAEAVMTEFTDIVIAYGESDEYSFVLKRKATLFQRRASKIETSVVSFFASNFVFHWHTFFPDTNLVYPPTFDARVVCYPSYENVRDYLSWRQVDCHINNLYNTCYWALVRSGKSQVEAEATLRGTLADFKNELLFSQFNINYNKLPQMYRKGSVLLHKPVGEPVKDSRTGEDVIRVKQRVVVVHEDIIDNFFWDANPNLLN
jgi:tRNA(His) guanylyltransferase